MSGVGQDRATALATGQEGLSVFDHPALAQLAAALGPDTFLEVWDSLGCDLERFEHQLATFDDGASIQAIKRVAHSVLGCAQACHAPMLAESARQLEQCCRSGDSLAVAALQADTIARLAETRANMPAAFDAVTDA